MPETSMHEDYLPASGKDHIRGSGQSLDVKTISKSKGVYCRSEP